MSPPNDKIKPLTPREGNRLAVTTKIQGARIRTHWRRQGDQLHRRLMDQMRMAMDNGETITQAFSRISGAQGVMNQARNAAKSLIATAVTAISNQARLLVGQINSNTIKGLQQVSVLDGRTSDICIAYAGQAWHIDTLRPFSGSTLPFNGGPPRHFHCRSILVPVIRSWRELGRSRDSNLDGQLAGDIPATKWLESKSESQLNAILGPGKAKLWRDGKITITDLVDQRGRPMTLAQLEEKVL